MMLQFGNEVLVMIRQVATKLKKYVKNIPGSTLVNIMHKKA